MRAVSVIIPQTNTDETATENTANKVQENITEHFQKDITSSTFKRRYSYSYLRLFYSYQIQLLPCAVNQALFFNEINIMYCSSM